MNRRESFAAIAALAAAPLVPVALPIPQPIVAPTFERFLGPAPVTLFVARGKAASAARILGLPPIAFNVRESDFCDPDTWYLISPDGVTS